MATRNCGRRARRTESGNLTALTGKRSGSLRREGRYNPCMSKPTREDLEELDRAGETLSKHVVQLFTSQEELVLDRSEQKYGRFPLLPFGSAVLLRSGKNLFLCTAQHCIDDLISSNETLFVESRTGGTITVHAINGDWCRSGGEWDLAMLLLTDEQSVWWDSVNFVNIGETLSLESPSTLHILGYRAAERGTKVNKSTGVIERRPFFYTGTVIRSDAHFSWVQITHNNSRRGKQQIAVGDLRGVSGGAAFAFDKPSRRWFLAGPEWKRRIQPAAAPWHK